MCALLQFLFGELPPNEPQLFVYSADVMAARDSAARIRSAAALPRLATIVSCCRSAVGLGLPILVGLSIYVACNTILYLVPSVLCVYATVWRAPCRNARTELIFMLTNVRTCLAL